MKRGCFERRTHRVKHLAVSKGKPSRCRQWHIDGIQFFAVHQAGTAMEAEVRHWGTSPFREIRNEGQYTGVPLGAVVTSNPLLLPHSAQTTVRNDASRSTIVRGPP